MSERDSRIKSLISHGTGGWLLALAGSASFFLESVRRYSAAIALVLAGAVVGVLGTTLWLRRRPAPSPARVSAASGLALLAAGLVAVVGVAFPVEPAGERTVLQAGSGQPSPTATPGAALPSDSPSPEDSPSASVSPTSEPEADAAPSSASAAPPAKPAAVPVALSPTVLSSVLFTRDEAARYTDVRYSAAGRESQTFDPDNFVVCAGVHVQPETLRDFAITGYSNRDHVGGEVDLYASVEGAQAVMAGLRSAIAACGYGERHGGVLGDETLRFFYRTEGEDSRYRQHVVFRRRNVIVQVGVTFEHETPSRAAEALATICANNLVRKVRV